MSDRKNIKTVVSDILNSGYTFDESECIIRSKYVTINIMLMLSVFIGPFFMYKILMLRGSLFLYSIIVFLSMMVFIFFALRKKRDYYHYLVSLLPINGIILGTVSLAVYPHETMRVAWFFIVILIAFFLGGYKIGLPIYLLSAIAITTVEFIVDTDLNSFSYPFAMLVLLLETIGVYLYDQREAKIQKGLKARIKSEVDMRTKEHIANSMEMEKQKEAYKKLAHYDSLTGLPNRSLFYSHLKSAIKKAKRNKKKMAVFFIDLDNFKEINDLLGHQQGDEVLLVISQRLQGHIRESDLLARLGGDEFTLIIEDFETIESLGAIAQNLRDTVSEVIDINDCEMHPTVSVGISIYPDDSTDIDELIKCADTAMYSAKNDGKNRFHFYSAEMTRMLLEKMKLEADIRKGIENDEFVVHYQPIIDTNHPDNRLAGLEALVRWNHPEKGILNPDTFIPVADTSYLVIQIGEKVLEQISNDMNYWHSKGFDPGFVSVNISSRQLLYDGFMKNVQRTIDAVGHRSDWLEFEIKESFAFHDPDKAIDYLNKIRELGVRLSMDDLGTGYSSLSHLKKLPIGKLKIDKSFMKDIPGDSEDEVLANMIIAMSQKLGLSVAAEGIESEHQKKFLVDAGCNIMQGYLFGKPMDADTIVADFTK